MSASDYVRNCPNCGAPIKYYGYCEYCETQIGLGERNPEAITRYELRDVRDKIADALADIPEIWLGIIGLCCVGMVTVLNSLNY